ncbi:MAG: hypothetical protein GY920_16815 [Aliivibrio sp.]|nr:hypothetical protein [Aliivibrio sp.]
MRLTVKQLILGDQFNKIATMSARDIAEFQRDLTSHFQGNFNAEPYKRAVNAVSERIHQLNNEFISPFAELVASYDKVGQGEKIRTKIAKQMDKPLDQVTDEQLESFYNQSLEDKRSESITNQQRSEARDKQHMAELIARSNQPAPERLEAMKKQHLHASKQRLTTLNRDGKMSEQAVNEFNEQAEADATQAVESFVKIQTGAF